MEDEDEYDDFYDEPYDCDCSEYEVDTLEGRAWCFRCQRHWYVTDEQLAREIKFFQADYMAQFECVEETGKP